MGLSTQLKIKHQIGILSAVVVVSFLTYLFANILVVKENKERLSQLSAIYYPVLEAATISNSKIAELTQAIETSVTIGDEDMLLSADDVYIDLIAQLDLINSIHPDKNRELLIIKNEAAEYYKSAKYLANGLISGTISIDNLSVLAEKNSLKLEKLLADLGQFKQDSQSEFTALINASLESSDSSRNKGVLLGVGVIILVLALCYWLTVSITGSIRKVSDSLKEIAQGDGDLTIRIDYTNKDEIGDLVYWFNQFLNKLHGSISETIQSIDSLSQVSTQLATSSSTSKSRIQEQSKSIDQVSRSMNEMFDTVRHIADYASNASLEASSANKEAETGTVVVDKTIEAIHDLANEVKTASKVIDELDSHTSNVGVILDTIRGIADQTNLLALNAAIEAARAGEQGRGFAVVADEVRTLASRTQDSTQEIQQVLEELQRASRGAVEAMQRGMNKAEMGVEQSSSASDSLISISGKVEAIHVVNEQIASATEEQAQTSKLIHGYIDETHAIATQVSQDTEVLDEIAGAIEVATQQLRQATNQFSV
ncbi:Methyl-accepting chemotaxis protein [Moritella viscosa]|uniref:Methyl-accepting chemotaxis protein n=1 Tax=Moritella viscosa TaxID=80854 RepID=A0A090IHZ7_9GAMM|nr:methyl-accepting chemotaxis protein [Moritella viscosa]CED61916.1 methyl-accepting chemotaxis protein [Moritella viscosa]SGY95561.1 Methyl-accepting chemotaxis protein [Moritella viscosa]SGZ00941.1 Methyl-accepting chemotaxis protein [Moritella viscosa]SHO06511.1 Methyl-accepting chemotaxis protein [Moritella viscosa]SHO07510.1 Methyl-accepting chemotaxis protein [Moritella viscosa]